jgi:hydrogenase/urease accessory protein HupE
MKRLAILLLAPPVFAHPGHEPAVTDYVAQPFAGADHMVVTLLVLAGIVWIARRIRAHQAGENAIRD